MTDMQGGRFDRSGEPEGSAKQNLLN